MRITALTAVGLSALVTASPFDYHGYKVFRINAGHEMEAVLLKDYLSDFNYEIYDSDNRGKLSVAVAPYNVTAFEALGLNTSVLHEDFGADIDAESGIGPGGKGSVMELGMQASNAKYSTSQIVLNSCLQRWGDWFDEWFYTYHEFYEHQDFWEALMACIPLNSANIKIGETYNTRDIRAFHFFHDAAHPTQDAIFLHANVFGRDWISTAAAEYFMLGFINDCLNNDEEALALFAKYDLYIIPVVNPDGMSETQQDDRNWQKNVQLRKGIDCPGTNLNRNWHKLWDVGMPQDGAHWPCMSTFRGKEPEDTMEVRAIRDYLKDKPVKLSVEWQASGQRVLWPSYSRSHADVKSTAAYKEKAGRILDFLNKLCTGDECTEWTGTWASKVSDFTGSTLDYMAGKSTEVLDPQNWAFVIQLGARDGQFVIPREEILPIGETQYKAMKWFIMNGI